MKPYTLKPIDYEEIYNQLELNFSKEKATQHFFKLIKALGIEFDECENILSQRNFLAFKPLELVEMKDFNNWPLISNYKVQKHLFHHFKSQGWDLSEVFREIVNTSVEFELKRKFVGVYIKGIRQELFEPQNTKEQNLALLTYLSAHNKKNEFATPILFLLKPLWPSEEFYPIVESILNKGRMTENFLFNDLLNDVEFIPKTYPKLKKALEFKLGPERELESLCIEFNTQELAYQFNCSEKLINKCFNDLSKWVDTQKDKKQSLIKDFSLQTLLQKLIVYASFTTPENKKLWKKDFDTLFSWFKSTSFEHNTAPKDFDKILLAKSLDTALHEKSTAKTIKI